MFYCELVVEINGVKVNRMYRVSSVRLVGDGKPMATAEYFHTVRGWREVQNWDRLFQLGELAKGEYSESA